MISVIILTFNSLSSIKACLNSLFAQDKEIDVEIILVDNGSKDKTADFVKKQYPQVKLIENKVNLGACQGRNQGIKACRGEWVFTLDCDVILEKDFLKKIFEFTKGLKSSVGMVGSKILNGDGKSVYSCGIFLSRMRRFYDIARNRVDSKKLANPRSIFGVCSAAGLYRKAMLEEIKEETGYFDERFFFLVEDVDLAWRAQRAGWRAQFCPEAICRHSGGSSGFDKQFRQYLSWRNRYYMITKNEGALGYGCRLLPGLFYDLPRVGYLFLANRYIRDNLLHKLKDNV